MSLSVPPRKTASAESVLCLACGMCCNGVIFGDVKLQPGDDPELLRNCGLPLMSAKSAAPSSPGGAWCGRAYRFTQPCAALDGCRCRLYGQRPQHCRSFECALLKGMKAGRIETAEALRTVARAARLVRDLERLLEQLGEHETTLPLRQRCRRVAARLTRRGAERQTAELFGQLTLKLQALTVLIDKAFYPGHAE